MEQFKLVSAESVFLGLTPEEATLFFYLWGILIAPELTIDEINVLANGLFETAQVLFVIASYRTLINDAIQAQQDKQATQAEGKSDTKLELKIKELQDQILHLQNQIDELQK